MKASGHQALSQFLKHLERHFNIHICFNDFVGFIPLDKELDLVLQPFMAHTNPFCTYVKSDKNLMQKCLSMKKKILDRCNRVQKPFYGVCHAGMGEMIYPIFYEGQLLGIINVGMFRSNSRISRYLTQRMCRNSSLNEKEAFALFEMSIKDLMNPEMETELHTNMQFVCSYLSNCFGKLSESYHAEHLLRRKHNSSENFILSHCLQYIKSNYKCNVDVAALQVLCHCSPSYIHHIFKKRTGKGVREYVNFLRVEEAKKLLTDTPGSIADISSEVGFQDPDYFSRVFSSMVGISPSKYRQRFLKEYR